MLYVLAGSSLCEQIFPLQLSAGRYRRTVRALALLLKTLTLAYNRRFISSKVAGFSCSTSMPKSPVNWV
jgi:hypothetical protein